MASYGEWGFRVCGLIQAALVSALEASHFCKFSDFLLKQLKYRSVWICVDLCGSMRICVDLYVSVWICGLRELWHQSAVHSNRGGSIWTGGSVYWTCVLCDLALPGSV